MPRPRPKCISAFLIVACSLAAGLSSAGCSTGPGGAGQMVVYTPNPLPKQELPAFPQAEGFGAYTPGGRGGRTYFITTLTDYRGSDQPIPGSLRQAIEAEGPRTVIFATGGTVELKKALRVRNPYLTIAGQTAPGGGICISRRGMEILTHDVVIRHVRIRPAAQDSSPDCISLRNARNVIIDHCSLSWSGDELFATTGRSSDITVQWCILAEPLDRRGHAEPVSLSGDRITLHHNLIAHGHRANPVVGGHGPIDFRNNVVYNWRAQASAGNAAAYNFVANYLRPGPDTLERGGLGARVAHWIQDPSPARSVHISGNVLEGQPASADNRTLVAPSSRALLEADPRQYLDTYLAPQAFPAEEVQTDSAEQAFSKVLQWAGATKPCRDAVDQRIVAEVAGGTGRIIRLAEDVGGLPDLAAGTPAPDLDGDGMPDAWEARNGLDASDATDATADHDGDGYTNIEEFLNSGDARERFLWVAPPAVSPEDGTIFMDSVTVSITCPTKGAQIRYTLNGSDATGDSMLYPGPFKLRRSATVKARAFRGFLASRLGYSTLRKVSPYPAQRPGKTDSGVAFEYREAAGLGPDGRETQWKLVESGVKDALTVDWVKADARLPIADFSGYLAVPRDGVYTFTLSAPLECVLWIDGAAVIRNDGRDDEDYQGAVVLVAGMHAIKVHYQAWWLGRALRVSWQGPGIAKQEVPASALLHVAPK